MRAPAATAAGPDTGLQLPRWSTARPAERLGYAVGSGLMVVGALHALVFLIDGGAWQGPVSWRKPTTFGLSFGLTVVTLTWLTTSLRLTPRGRWWLLGVLAAANVAEVGGAVLQAWRRVPSHFNQETAFDTAVFYAMGVSVAVIVAVILVVTVRSFTSATGPASSRLAIRAGLVLLVAAQGIGGAMIARGLTALETEGQAEAYVAGGSLKLAHAVTMHAVQVLPLLVVGLAWLALPEHRRMRIVRVATAAYAVLAGGTLVAVLA